MIINTGMRTDIPAFYHEWLSKYMNRIVLSMCMAYNNPTAVRPAEWFSIEVSVVKAVSPTVRDSFQLKRKLVGCSCSICDALTEKISDL